MKNKFFYLFVVLSVLNVLNSCSKNDSDVADGDKITAADIGAIKKAVTSGDWYITYYFDTDKEETSDYNGYVFTFNTDGALGVTNGNTALSGAWSVTDSSTSDDSSEGDIDFNIFFATPDIFQELSDDWVIQKYSDDKITLIDVSGGNGGIDYLTFEK